MLILLILFYVQVVVANQNIDLILNELQELEYKIEQLQEKMGISQDYQDEYMENEIDQQLQERNIFLQGIKEKFVKQFDGEQISDIQVLHLRQLQYPHTFLLVCVQNKMNIIAINMLGRIVAKWIGFSQITLTNINQFTDEIVVAIYDEFNKSIILNLKHYEVNTQENTTYIYEQAEIDADGVVEVFEIEETSSFKVEHQIGNGVKINAMIVNQARGSKIVIFGDSTGHIMYFTEKKHQVILDQRYFSRENSCQQRTSNRIYSKKSAHNVFKQIIRSKLFKRLNNLDLQMEQLYKLPCHFVRSQQSLLFNYIKRIYTHKISMFYYRIWKSSYTKLNKVSKVIAQVNQLVYHYSKLQDSLIQYSVIPKRHQIQYGYDQQLFEPIIFRFRQFEYIQHIKLQTQVQKNTIHYDRTFTDEALLLDGLQDKITKNITNFEIKSIKKSQTISYTYQLTSQQQGSQLKFMEITHVAPFQSAFSFSFFESFRFPMILVAIFIVFIFQYWQRKKKSSDLDGDDDQISVMAKKKIDSMIQEYQNAKSSQPRQEKPKNLNKNEDEMEISYNKFA